MHIPTEPSKQANNSDINDCKYPKIQAHQETPLTSNSHVENSQTEKKRNKHFISAELEKVLFNRMKMDHMKEGIKILSLDKQTKLQRYNAIIVICHSLDGKVLQQQQNIHTQKACKFSWFDWMFRFNVFFLSVLLLLLSLLLRWAGTLAAIDFISWSEPAKPFLSNSVFFSLVAHKMKTEWRQTEMEEQND